MKIYRIYFKSNTSNKMRSQVVTTSTENEVREIAQNWGINVISIHTINSTEGK